MGVVIHQQPSLEPSACSGVQVFHIRGCLNPEKVAPMGGARSRRWPTGSEDDSSIASAQAGNSSRAEGPWGGPNAGVGGPCCRGV